MFRRAAWFSSLTIGFALACDALAAQAPEAPAAQDVATPRLQSAPAQSPQAPRQADYVVETFGEDEEVDRHFLKDDSNGINNDLSQFDNGEAPPDEAQTEVIKERFPDGSVRIERNVTQDAEGNYLNHGPWKMWDENGNLVAQGDYANGNRTGVWVRWYRNVAEADLLSKIPYQQFLGPFISQATFENGQLNGLWTIYDNRMRKISQWAFADGKRHGISNWWYANGRKMREVQFREGRLDGQFLEWTPDGAERVKEHLSERPQTGSQADASRRRPEKVGRHVPVCQRRRADARRLVELHNPGHGQERQGRKARHVRRSGTPTDRRSSKAPTTTTCKSACSPGGTPTGKRRSKVASTKASRTALGPGGMPTARNRSRAQYAHGTPTGRWTWWKEDGKVVPVGRPVELRRRRDRDAARARADRRAADQQADPQQPVRR